MLTEKPETILRGGAIWPADPPLFFPALVAHSQPRRLLIPLLARRGSGTEARPAETVLRRGEPLCASPLSAPAPLDGRTGELIDITLTSGKRSRAIEFFPSQSQEIPSDEGKLQPPETLDAIIELLRSLAPVDRRDAPELLDQLHEAKSRPVDTIICSVLDTDSTLRINGSIAARAAGELAQCVKLLMKLTSAARGIIAMESNAPPEWAKPVRESVARAQLEIVDLENEYPQADPTLLIYTLTNQKLSPVSLPPSQRAIVLDAAAAVALWRAARDRRPEQTPVGIRDHLRGHSHFLSVHAGTVLADVLAELEIDAREITLRGGDLLRDIRLPLDAVIGGSELAIHISGPEVPINSDPCIRSGWCMEACPTLVQPANILEAAQRHDYRKAEHAGLRACIECGLCTYVCPSRLPILESIRYLKREVPPGTAPRRWSR